MTKTKSLDKEILENYNHAQETIGFIEDTLVNRLDYVIQFIFSHFTKNTKIYWEYNSWEWVCRHPDPMLHVEYVYTRDLRHSKSMSIIDKYNKIWNIEDGIPKRWLFEDFETEFEIGLTKYKQKTQ